jgi:hypothetical protein
MKLPASDDRVTTPGVRGAVFGIGAVARSSTNYSNRRTVYDQASGRTPSVIPSSPEVIPCQHPHPERFPQSKHFPWKNEFAGEPASLRTLHPARQSIRFGSRRLASS